jgi:hypothetical protein
MKGGGLVGLMNSSQATFDIRQALTQAGLWPSGSVDGELSCANEPWRDLLPPIIDVWNRLDGSCDDADSSVLRPRRDAWIRLHLAGGQMTWGIPSPTAAAWLGTRLAWWPRGVLRGRRVGLISSRLGRNIEQHKAWFAALRTACIRLDPACDLLLTADSSALHRFVRRCGQLFGVPALCIEVGQENRLTQWADRIATREAAADATRAWADVSLSPPSRINDAGPNLRELAATPVADRAVMALGDLLIVLHIRPGGHVHRLLDARLSCADFPTASVFLALGDDFVPRKIAEPLMDRGAVGWYVTNRGGQTGQDVQPPWPAAGMATAVAAPIIDCPHIDAWPYLTHCTRRRQGPWPGQTEDDYLDDLILDRRGADHSAFAALWRIVRNRQLLASSELVRGDQAVVSLTEVALEEIQSLRTYRSHLGRWDFEPYGICIRRQWLQRHGVRPVQYGDDALWEKLSADDRPFFQKRQTKTAKGTVIDWTVEREWRWCGDLPLADVPRDAAIVFVPSRREAEQLAVGCPWPVAVLPLERRRGLA